MRLPQRHQESWGEAELGLSPPGQCARGAGTPSGAPWAALPRGDAGVPVSARRPFPRPIRGLLVLLGPLAAHSASLSPSRGRMSPISQGKQGHMPSAPVFRVLCQEVGSCVPQRKFAACHHEPLINKNKKQTKKITETNTVMSSTEPQSTFQSLSGFKKICGLPKVHFRVIFPRQHDQSLRPIPVFGPDVLSRFGSCWCAFCLVLLPACLGRLHPDQ